MTERNTPIADALAQMSDAELIEAAAEAGGDFGRRLAELERKINHADLPAEVVRWLAGLAEHGAITGNLIIPAGPHSPALQYSIFPDGKLWLQLCDVNMRSVWRLMLTGPGKVHGNEPGEV